MPLVIFAPYFKYISQLHQMYFIVSPKNISCFTKIFQDLTKNISTFHQIYFTALPNLFHHTTKLGNVWEFTAVCQKIALANYNIWIVNIDISHVPYQSINEMKQIGTFKLDHAWKMRPHGVRRPSIFVEIYQWWKGSSKF